MHYHTKSTVLPQSRSATLWDSVFIFFIYCAKYFIVLYLIV